MATRLLSFLGSVESALRAQAPGPGWEISRMVNYHLGLARMVLRPSGNNRENMRAGGILLQDFKLADGSTCLKASLSWDGSASVPLLAVYAKPQTAWDQEAAQIASAWLRGPEAAGDIAASEIPERHGAPVHLASLAAAVG